jgi:hypothetical protein
MTYSPPSVYQRRDLMLIGTHSPESLGVPLTTMALGTGTASAWPTTNLAIYVPFQIPYSMNVVMMWECHSTTSGNFDLGIYKEDGTTIITKGTTAMAGTNVMQQADITDTLLPGPARYYMGMSVDNTTATIFRANPAVAGVVQALGVFQQASAFVLPTSSATFAQNTTWTVVPLFGIAGRTAVA